MPEDNAATEFAEQLHELFEQQDPKPNSVMAVFITDGVYSYRCSFRGEPQIHELVLSSDDLS